MFCPRISALHLQVSRAHGLVDEACTRLAERLPQDVMAKTSAIAERGGLPPGPEGADLLTDFRLSALSDGVQCLSLCTWATLRGGSRPPAHTTRSTATVMAAKCASWCSDLIFGRAFGQGRSSDSQDQCVPPLSSGELDMPLPSGPRPPSQPGHSAQTPSTRCDMRRLGKPLTTRNARVSCRCIAADASMMI